MKRFMESMILMTIIAMLHYLVVRLFNQTAFSVQFQTDADMPFVAVLPLIGLAAMMLWMEI